MVCLIVRVLDGLFWNIKLHLIFSDKFNISVPVRFCSINLAGELNKALNRFPGCLYIGLFEINVQTVCATLCFFKSIRSCLLSVRIIEIVVLSVQKPIRNDNAFRIFIVILVPVLLYLLFLKVKIDLQIRRIDISVGIIPCLPAGKSRHLLTHGNSLFLWCLRLRRLIRFRFRCIYICCVCCIYRILCMFRFFCVCCHLLCSFFFRLHFFLCL